MLPTRAQRWPALGKLLSKIRTLTARDRGKPSPIRPSEIPEAGLASGTVTEDINHHLGLIRGCCEIAKLKGEQGDALVQRMDTAIDAVGQTQALVERLATALRRQSSTSEAPPHANSR